MTSKYFDFLWKCFPLNGWLNIWIFFHLMLLSFNVCFIQKYVLKILIEKNILKKFLPLNGWLEYLDFFFHLMLISFNVCLMQKYVLKILGIKKIYKKIWFHPLSGRFFFKNFFRLMGELNTWIFFRLMLLSFNVLFYSKICLENIWIKKNIY